jgi:hypothetical protein
VAVQLFAAVTVTVYVVVLAGEIVPVVALVPRVLLQEYVPPPVAVNVVEALLQSNEGFAAVAVTLGIALLTVTVTVFVAVQPFVPVTVTV